MERVQGAPGVGFGPYPDRFKEVARVVELSFAQRPPPREVENRLQLGLRAQFAGRRRALEEAMATGRETKETAR
jgi:hypothetical protein